MAPASRQKLHVLWATDGSASARTAVPLLRGLVLPAAERLTVLTVAPPSLTSGARPDPAFIARVTPAARRGALVEAEQLAMREATALDPPFRPDVLSRWGHPIQEVLRAARSLAADLIVLGAKGHSNLRILVLGSVSQGVVQHATLPVLIARPSAGPVRRVVLGYHGSAAGPRAPAPRPRAHRRRPAQAAAGAPLPPRQHGREARAPRPRLRPRRPVTRGCVRRRTPATRRRCARPRRPSAPGTSVSSAPRRRDAP